MFRSRCWYLFGNWRLTHTLQFSCILFHHYGVFGPWLFGFPAHTSLIILRYERFFFPLVMVIVSQAWLSSSTLQSLIFCASCTVIRGFNSSFTSSSSLFCVFPVFYYYKNYVLWEDRHSPVVSDSWWEVSGVVVVGSCSRSPIGHPPPSLAQTARQRSYSSFAICQPITTAGDRQHSDLIWLPWAGLLTLTLNTHTQKQSFNNAVHSPSVVNSWRISLWLY